MSALLTHNVEANSMEKNVPKREKSSYLLGKGEKGAKALELQQSMMSQESCTLLERAGLKDGQVVWDIGCGNGTMIPYLAKKVGPTGHVYAVDASAEQLQLAKARAASAGLSNVTFLQRSVMEMGDLPADSSADIVYTRLLFMHLSDPKKALKAILKILKPGGRLTCEESVFGAISTSQPIQGISDYRDSMIKLGRLRQQDYNIGEKMETICGESGFINVQAMSKESKLSAQETSELWRLRIGETAQKILKAGLATQEQVDHWKVMHKEIPLEDESFYSISGMLYYILAQKPE
ncbi:MAG TPA: hypothetical protein DD412_05580 [Holosporales bacterium]|nr:hypothetical protein [Holosporales bacterium]